MKRIKVTLLNFGSPFCTHIEVMLQDLSHDRHNGYYIINRWEEPLDSFCDADQANIKQRIEEATSKYSFEINENPDHIVRSWNDYYKQTEQSASILGKNCAVATQWFLETFANIPRLKRTSMPLSCNHLTLGIFVPNFAPIGITLAGRVFDHAKFNIDLRAGKFSKKSSSSASLNLLIALSTIAIIGSIAAIVAASIFLTSGLVCAAAIAGAVIVGLSARYGLFKSINTKVGRQRHESAKKQDDYHSYHPSKYHMMYA